MCYKQEQHVKFNKMVEDQIKDYPKFIKDYFVFLNSAKTKYTNLSYIKGLFDWVLSQGIIQRDSISKITAEDIQNISAADIVRYLRSLESGEDGKVNSPRTIQTKITVFNTLWAFWVDERIVPVNIISSLKHHRTFKVEAKHGETTQHIKLPTDEQIKAFYAHVDKDNNDFRAVRNHAIISLMEVSGIREEELIGLDLSDVHFDDDGAYIEVMGKGKINVKDDVSIANESACMALKEYMEYRSYVPNVIDTEALFISQRKRKRLTPSGLSYMFKQHSDGQITPHMLRHRCATKLYEQGLSAVDIARHLRHKNINTTNTNYIHPSRSNLNAALACL